MKILGMGNALIDILAKLDDDTVLNELHLPKGGMTLIDMETRNALMERMASWTFECTTGGSAGNTCRALGAMQVPVGFIGKVGTDEYGTFFVDTYRRAGVEPYLIRKDQPSGTAMTFISPDGERTFGTYLGVAAELLAADVSETILMDYTHLYIEGYLVQNHQLIETALKTAKARGLTTAMDLASYNVVAAEKEFLLSLIHNYVDIVFANEEEAKELTGLSPEAAVKAIGRSAQIAIVKTGGEGSWVMQGEQVVNVPVKTIRPVDTTAAGDYYAAGFLFGLQQGASLTQCAQLGSLLALEIIQVVGTHLSDETWASIRNRAQEILND